MEKVDIETAELELERFAEAMDLDLDADGLDDDDRTQLEKMKRRFMRGIQNGSLVVNDSGEAIYTPQKSSYQEPIHFHERTGATVLASDGFKKGKDMAKTYAAMADLCRIPSKVFANLRGIDIKMCETIFALLMD